MHLPDFVTSLFWDCDLPNVQRQRDFILGRVLTVGSSDAIKWIRSELGDPAIRDWIIRRQGGPLSPPQLRFWELILDLPSELVDAWLLQPERRLWWERNRCNLN